LRSIETQTAEGKSDGDREILVGSDYECCHLQADDTETSEQNDSIEDNRNQQNHPEDVNRTSIETPKSSNDEESLQNTGQGAGRNKGDDADDPAAEETRRDIEEIETANVDTVEDAQSADDKASDADNTEESAATPAKRKGDADDASRLAKKSKNDESPQPEDSKESDSIGGGPVEEPSRNDQETIAANMSLVLHVESDEEIETVPV
jgi:hypothetical protein